MSDRAAAYRILLREDPTSVTHKTFLAVSPAREYQPFIAGRQPVELTARRLRRLGARPLEWDRQRRFLGFPA